MSETTPSGVRIVAHMPDGSEVNVTESVQTLYDLVTGSMDWGSGFLTVEDALPVVHVAKTCGFQGYQEAERYVEALRRSDEQRRLARERLQQSLEQIRKQQEWLVSHEHVYGDTGQCVYPACRVVQQPAFTARMDVKGSTEPHREVEWTMLPEGHRIRVSINGPLSAEAILAFENQIRRATA